MTLLDAWSEALARWNWATQQRLDHPEDPEVRLAWLFACWRWDEFKRGLAAEREGR